MRAFSNGAQKLLLLRQEERARAAVGTSSEAPLQSLHAYAQRRLISDPALDENIVGVLQS